MKNILAAASGYLKKNIHIPLLLFLLIFTVDKILLKFAGIIIIYLLHPDFNFRKNFKKIPLFYLFLVILEAIKFLLFNKDFTKGHLVTFALGCLFWLIGFLALHQFRSIIDKTEETRIDSTLKLFFLINCAISLLNLLLAIYHSGSLDPYRLSDPVYGNSTGDLIKGLFQGPSYINMMTNSLFIFYFLHKRQFRFATIALVVAAFTTSNFGNLVLFPILISCFIFKKDRQIRQAILSFFGIIILFYLAVSPSNFRYLRDSIFVPKKRQQEFLAYEKKAALQARIDSQATIRAVPGSQPGSSRIEYTPSKINEMVRQMQLDSSSNTHLTLTGKYGKVQAFKETAQYLVSSPRAFLFGAGIGCFSSFLAERISGVNREEGSRLFSHLPSYIAPDFYTNHYQIFKTVYDLPKEFHSIKHFPNSFLNQLFGEYGVIGALLFLLTYVFFFVRHFRRLTYGKYLLFLMGGFLFFDYLFEYLSIVSVFELLMLCDIKRVEETPAGDSGLSLQTKGMNG